MCMYIDKTTCLPIQLKEDLIAYKAFRKSSLKLFGITIKVISPFQNKFYFFNKKYKTTIKKEVATCDPYFDDIELKRISKSNISSYNRYAIYKGFHCAINKNRLFKSLATFDCDIYKVKIPKGSIIYKGIDEELIVSNQIIVTKEKC